MIEKLSKLSVNKRTLVYLSLLVFVMGVLIAIAVWVPIHFELGFEKRYSWLVFSVIVITSITFLVILCIGKLEDTAMSLKKEPNEQEFLEVAQTSHSHWIFTKFKGDRAIYAICPHCDFHYNPSILDENLNPVISSVFKYCPMCAEYLYITPENIKVDVETNRYITEVYETSDKKVIK